MDRETIIPSQAGVHHTPTHNANVTHTARNKKGEKGVKDSPFCSLLLEYWNLLLRLDSA